MHHHMDFTKSLKLHPYRVLLPAAFTEVLCGSHIKLCCIAGHLEPKTSNISFPYLVWDHSKLNNLTKAGVSSRNQ